MSLLLCKWKDRQPNEGYEYYKKLSDDSSKTADEKERTSHILVMFTAHIDRNWYNHLDSLVKKIEVAESFLNA